MEQIKREQKEELEQEHVIRDKYTLMRQELTRQLEDLDEKEEQELVRIKQQRQARGCLDAMVDVLDEAQQNRHVWIAIPKVHLCQSDAIGECLTAWSRGEAVAWSHLESKFLTENDRKAIAILYDRRLKCSHMCIHAEGNWDRVFKSRTRM